MKPVLPSKVLRGRPRALAGLVYAAALAWVIAIAALVSAKTTVLPPGFTVPAPLSAGEWSARWWQWNLSTPDLVNPTLDSTGGRCGEGQSGPIFYLAGAPVSAPVTRTCTVPAGKLLFFPLVTVECSNQEPAPFFGENEAELRACAAGVLNNVSLKLTVDGVPVENLIQYRALSPAFAFTLPEDNQLGRPKGRTGIAVADGFWIALRLDPGRHVIHFEAKVNSGPAAGFEQNITYNLTQN
jgi:hypothetical protein